MCDYVCVCICYVCVQICVQICVQMCRYMCIHIYIYTVYIYIYAHLLTHEYILFLLPCSPAPRRVQQHGQCQGPWSRPQSDEHGEKWLVVSCGFLRGSPKPGFYDLDDLGHHDLGNLHYVAMWCPKIQWSTRSTMWFLFFTFFNGQKLGYSKMG